MKTGRGETAKADALVRALVEGEKSGVSKRSMSEIVTAVKAKLKVKRAKKVVP